MLTVLLFACVSKESNHEGSVELFSPGVKLAEITNNKLGEISGIAASVVNPRMLWVHNDSGNDPEIYLLDENLDVKLTVRLDGVENRDWEDIAVGPGPENGKSYVYVGEIGDNDARYENKYIYRFEEPKWNGEHDHSIALTDFDKITFRLEDAVKDSETLLVDPTSKNLYVVSKREEPVYVYELKFPQSTDEITTAKKTASIPFATIVGGDISPDGTELLLKNYTQVFYWNTTSSKSLLDILKSEPRQIPYESEPQGESIVWARDKSGFYTISEVVKEEKSYLYFYKRK